MLLKHLKPQSKTMNLHYPQFLWALSHAVLWDNPLSKQLYRKPIVLIVKGHKSWFTPPFFGLFLFLFSVWFLFCWYFSKYVTFLYVKRILFLKKKTKRERERITKAGCIPEKKAFIFTSPPPHLTATFSFVPRIWPLCRGSTELSIKRGQLGEVQFTLT